MKINGTRVDNSGRRPWLDGKREGIKGREPKNPVSDREQAEIAKCLACTCPDCMGWCTRSTAKGGRPVSSIPPDFARRTRAGERVKDLARAYHVSTTTVAKWRQALGLQGCVAPRRKRVAP